MPCDAKMVNGDGDLTGVSEDVRIWGREEEEPEVYIDRGCIIPSPESTPLKREVTTFPLILGRFVF